MFSISEFKSRYAPVRPNQFFAEITLPQTIQNLINGRSKTSGGATLYGSARDGDGVADWFRSNNFANGNLNDTFKFRCEAAELPGKTIATVDDTSYGATVKYAYDTTYNDINLTIMASEDMRERAYFEIWMDNIVFTPHKNRNINDITGGLIRYYDEYAVGGKLNIYQVNDRGVQLVKYTCENVFPLALSPMTASWEENDTYQRFTVTMSYRYHTVDFLKKPLIPDPPPPPANFGRGGLFGRRRNYVPPGYAVILPFIPDDSA